MVCDDTFLIIFGFLPIADKISCLTSCKRWYNKISEYRGWTLYEYGTCLRYGVYYLVKHADIDLSEHGIFALSIVAETGNVKIMELLLADSRVDAAMCHGALRAAMSSNRVNVIKILLTDTRVCLATHGAQVLIHAISIQRDDIVQLVVASPRFANGEVTDALISHAVRHACTPVIEYLLSRGYAEHLLHTAARSNNTQIMKILLGDLRVNPACRDSYVLHIAAVHRSFKIIDLLIRDPRIDPSIYNNIALRTSASYGETDIAEYLIKHPLVNPADYDSAAFISAAVCGNLKIVKLLLEDPRIDPAAYNSYVLRIAVAYKQEHVVKLLMSDPRVDPSADNNSSLYAAQRLGYDSIVDLLLADSRVRNKL